MSKVTKDGEDCLLLLLMVQRGSETHFFKPSIFMQNDLISHKSDFQSILMAWECSTSCTKNPI